MVVTKSAEFFLNRAKAYHPDWWDRYAEAQSTGRVQVIHDADEWEEWSVVGDAVVHIDVRGGVAELGCCIND